MTRVRFIEDNNIIHGFEIKGHCTVDSDDIAGKLVCAAVSSAAYMTVNTITDIIFDKAEINCGEDLISLFVKDPQKETICVLKGFRLHLEQLSEQYGSNIKIYGGANRVKD